MGNKAFCNHCNAESDTYTVIREWHEDNFCLTCGLPTEIDEFSPFHLTGKVLFADDSSLMRELLWDVFTKHDLAKSFITYKNGEELLKQYLRMIMKNEPVSLAILDTIMPFMDGTATAAAIRVIEQTFEKQPVPILFISVKQADEELHRLITHAKPAYYLNKSATDSIDVLAKRVILSLRSILKK